MNCVFVRCLALAALGVAVLSFSTTRTTTAADVTPIKEIMAKAAQGWRQHLGNSQKRFGQEG